MTPPEAPAAHNCTTTNCDPAKMSRVMSCAISVGIPSCSAITPQVIRKGKTPTAKGRTACTPPRNSLRLDGTDALHRTHCIVLGY
jgi:hypothetical protein